MPQIVKGDTVKHGVDLDDLPILQAHVPCTCIFVRLAILDQGLRVEKRDYCIAVRSRVVDKAAQN